MLGTGTGCLQKRLDCLEDGDKRCEVDLAFTVKIQDMQLPAPVGHTLGSYMFGLTQQFVLIHNIASYSRSRHRGPRQESPKKL